MTTSNPRRAAHATRPWPARAPLVHALACTIALVHAPMSQAADAPQKEHSAVHSLAPVVVTATFQQSPLTTVIDPKVPQQPIPASDGADLLKTVPGFSVMRKGGSNGDPVFRGMSGSRLAIVADGTQLAGGGSSRMDPPTSYISPALYDRVVIIKGPETVIAGPVGSAGTVLFERETPTYTKADATLDASTTVGSFGRNDQTVDFKGGTPLFYVDVDGNRTHSNDYRDGNGDKVHSSYNRWNVNTALGWTPDKNTSIELSAGTGNGQAAYAFSAMDGIKFLRQSTALKFEKKHLTEHWTKLEAKVYRNDIDHVMDNYTLRKPDPDSTMPLAMASDLQRNTTGGRIAATFDWANRFHLVTGLDATSSTHNSRVGGPIGSPMGYYKAKPRVRDARMENQGVFAEGTWHATAKDRLIAGARIDRPRTRGYKIATGTDSGMNMGSMGGMGDSTKMPSSGAMTLNTTRDATLPSGFVRYEHDMKAPATFYAGIGHSERFPDYWELFGQHVGTTVATFRGLRPERTTQLDVGLQYHSHRVKAWVSGYAGIIDDFILIHYGKTSGYANNVKARIAGGEVGAEYRLTDCWKASATLAYAWGEDRTENRPLPQMPPLESRLGLTWDNGTWSGGALWRVVAPQNRVALGEGNIVGQDLGKSAGYGIFSLHAGWRIAAAWNLTAGIDNVLGKTYAEHISPSVVAIQGFTSSTRVNEPGRVAWMKLSLSL
ncbi:MAG: TonB-dependent copper receptor [Rhodanobacter sp.]|nr:MAG: TonB-dependent copper receptor [Rhodanobacter sp.]